jgi:adenosylhomocysteinase
MAFHFTGTQLRVVQKFCRERRNKDALGQARFIILEHILPNTEQFIALLKAGGADIFAIFAKPYSIDKTVLNRMASQYRVLCHTYDELEDSRRQIIDGVIREALILSRSDGRAVIIIDVGGYFAEPVVRLQKTDDLELLAGIVEDTIFGHNRYTDAIANIKIPIFSVARSVLKEIEARFVGREAVVAAEFVLRNIGVMLSGRHALILGYGMIGSSVARSLRAHDVDVSVYDKTDHRNLQAYIDGFNIYPKRQVIARADIIFSATAATALSFNEIEECKDGVILVSVGSRDSEFDVRSLKDQAVANDKLSEHLTEYRLSNSRAIRVIKDGTAINFLLGSLPSEVVDLVFAEIVLCAMLILTKQADYPAGVIYTAREEGLDKISLEWLRHVNN